MVSGVVHLQQYFGPYQAIPTIGVLFLLDFAAAIAIGIALLAPIEHLTGRWAGATVAIVTAAGIALAAGSLVMLTISEHTPLFGFQEPGYDPAAIASDPAVRDRRRGAAERLARCPLRRQDTETPVVKGEPPMKLGLKSVSVAAVAAALALAACGGSDDDGASNTTTAGTAGASNDTVSVADVEGVGEILVDASGRALYFADEEADGQVRCVDGCTSFWQPLEPGSDAPTAAPGVPELGVVDRPDGTEQVTAGGRLLYTFSEDSPGDVSGDGFEDDFGSQHLTWHALRVDGGTTPAAGSSTDGGYPGYGG